MFKTATRIRFYIYCAFVLFFGIVGNGYYADHLYGHFDVAFTVMVRVLIKGLPYWMPAVIVLNLIALAWNKLAARVPSIRTVCDKRFFVAMNCLVMLLSADYFFAVVSARIELLGQ